MPDKPKTTLSKSEINRRHYKKRVEKARKEGRVSKAATKPDLIEYDRFPQNAKNRFRSKGSLYGLKYTRIHLNHLIALSNQFSRRLA